ncbi:MAG: sodium:calcium antiporter, partial [Candidatus Nanohaloarchaea archaeon]|nr:sodium:calcium antiporter [Candidatus Nanohaloarchaea archaeon]
IFNILVIPSAATLVGENVLGSNRDLVYKEAQFYIIAVATLLLTFSFAAIYNPVSGSQILGMMTRPLAMLPIMVYGLYVFIQYQETVEHEAEKEVDISPLKQWALLIASLAVITVGVEGLVRSAIGLGNALNTPSFLWGLTVIAAGTSLPDAFVSIKASREGRSVTSVSNVLGSNIFDLLVAIPAGILVAGSAVINYSRAAPMMGYLVFATIVLFVFMRTDFELSEKEVYGLLGVYLLFLIWMTLETFGVTSLAL